MIAQRLAHTLYELRACLARSIVLTYSRNREADGSSGHQRQEHKNDLTNPSLEGQACEVVECFVQHTILTLFSEFGSLH